MVDMVTSKNSLFGRVLVSVLDSKAILEQFGVLIGDCWFEFPIEVDSIIHGVESYAKISTDQGDKDDTNDDEIDDLLGDDDLMGGGNTKDGSIMQARVLKIILMLIWTHLRMWCSQVTKLLVTNQKISRLWHMRF